MKESPKDHCLICKHHYEYSQNNRWCSKFGQSAKAAVGHCKNTNSRNIKTLHTLENKDG